MYRTLHYASLRELPVFETLTIHALIALQKIAVLYELRAGEYLYHQGDLADSFYVVQQGAIQLVEHTTEGQDVHLKVYGRGDLFGLLAISGRFPHPSAGQAADESVVIGFAGAKTREAIKQHADIGLLFVDQLIAHVHHSHGRIRQMAAERVERRLARALLHYAEKFGRPAHEADQAILSIDVPLSQRDLSEFVGATVETVNRVLRAWEQKHYIRVSRQHVDVLNHPALFGIAEDQAYMGQTLF
jgi:CRP-like cAMP-binding protein